MKARNNALLFFMAAFLLCSSYQAESRVDVNLSIGVPSPFVFAGPPEVVLIPGTYAYFVPGIDVDILFYHGYWYRPFEGRWYRANRYDGRWTFVAPGRVLSALLGLPHDYRHILPGYHRIPHTELRQNWKRWEREKHWDRERKEKRHEHERDRGRGEHRDEERGRY